MQDENRLYFKIGSNVVSAPKEDCEKQVIDCSKVKVLMWLDEAPFYRFEHNSLAQHIAESEDIYCYDGHNSPDSLIDKDIIKALKKRLANKKTITYESTIADIAGAAFVPATGSTYRMNYCSLYKQATITDAQKRVRALARAKARAERKQTDLTKIGIDLAK